MPRTPPATLLYVASAALLASACGDDDASATATDGATTDSTTGDGTTAVPATGDPTTGADETGDSEPPIELTPDLCDDPANIALLDTLVEAGLGAEDPSYGMRNDAQLQRMLDDPLTGPFYMVNLIRYRELAVYPDGRDTDLSGREANDLYAPVEFLEAIGANVVFTGPVTATTLGDADVWEDVAIVEYPCPLALFAMGAHPEFQERSIHKDAGLEASIVMVTHRQPIDDPGPLGSPFPPSAEDPAFEHVQVLAPNEQAQYDAASGEPERTGAEALALYGAALDEAGPTYGVLPRARLVVEGEFIGDGRAWTDVWIDYVPSGAAFDALHADEGVVAAEHHRDAALEHGYGLRTDPFISAIPGAPEGGEPTPLPVTPDGTGTLCQTDADCPGDGVETCLNPDGAGGFCTREGCGAGECESPYLCCHDCSEMVAAVLPFDGSACLPETASGQLSEPPAACTCD